ncbi:hypothetical protein ACFSWE_05020 [Leucobacter albus]|uniref:Nucleotidyltransferase-like protein n=1 Tax=Leucobacter albus TaxID=272210 RepID=A0ABW3TNK7_9MICO
MNERPQRVVSEPYRGAWLDRPWAVVSELSELLPPFSWTLIGGLMVQVQAYLYGVPASRVTDDVDAILHLETSAVTFAGVGRLLQSRGFSLVHSQNHAYRFRRDADKIDVMVADRYAASRSPTHDRRQLLGVPGGTRALSNTSNVTLRDHAGVDVARFSLPSLKGAFVLKGAAYLVDQRDRDRHVEDGITLLACVSHVQEIREGLTFQSRRRIRALLRAIASSRESWLSLEPDTQARARLNLPEMEAAFDVSGTDNSWKPLR